jgi:hypothetical protein
MRIVSEHEDRNEGLIRLTMREGLFRKYDTSQSLPGATVPHLFGTQLGVVHSHLLRAGKHPVHIKQMACSQLLESPV